MLIHKKTMIKLLRVTGIKKVEIQGTLELVQHIENNIEKPSSTNNFCFNLKSKVRYICH